MSFAETINADAKTANDEAGELVDYLPKSGGVLKIYVVPRFGGVEPRKSDGGETLATELVLEVSKTDVPAVVRGSDRVTFPGGWVRSEAALVTWRVAAIAGDAASPGVWKLVMASR